MADGNPTDTGLTALQARILQLEPAMTVSSVDVLLREVRRLLLLATEDGKLKTPVHLLWKHVRAVRDQSAVRDLLETEQDLSGVSVLVGGVKNQKRDRSLPHFERDDGAWFDFSIAVREARGRSLSIEGYNFELRFPHGHMPSFIRFDLNLPGHANEDDGFRSHMHPGNDDVIAPSPWMSPLEVLDLIVHGLRPMRPKARSLRG